MNKDYSQKPINLTIWTVYFRWILVYFWVIYHVNYFDLLIKRKEILGRNANRIFFFNLLHSFPDHTTVSKWNIP